MNIEPLSDQGDRIMRDAAADLDAAQDTMELRHKAAVAEFERIRRVESWRRATIRALIAVAIGFAVLFAVALAARAEGTFQIVPGIDNPTTTPPSPEFTDAVVNQSAHDSARQIERYRRENAETAAKVRANLRELRRREIMKQVYGHPYRTTPWGRPGRR